jgi:hypothetical protein
VATQSKETDFSALSAARFLRPNITHPRICSGLSALRQRETELLPNACFECRELFFWSPKYIRARPSTTCASGWFGVIANPRSASPCAPLVVRASPARRHRSGGCSRRHQWYCCLYHTFSLLPNIANTIMTTKSNRGRKATKPVRNAHATSPCKSPCCLPQATKSPPCCLDVPEKLSF